MTPDPPPAPPRPPGRGTRRGFVLGGLAGLAVGKATEYVQPLEWTQRGLPTGTKLSFAQTGEDLVVAELLAGVGADPPSYLDIGAWEPIESNNTYLFYRRGGRGVLVEPNPALTEKLRSKRPGDTTLQAGIGLTDATEADYFVLNEPQLNTFDKAQADMLVRDHGRRLERVLKMPLLNVNRVIAEHFGGAAPDLLSIDIEGLDFDILRTLDYDRFRPKVICAETLVTMTKRHNPKTGELLAAKGYEVRGMTNANTMFVDGRLLGG